MAESREQLRSTAFDPEGQLRRLHRSEPLRPGQMTVARELVRLRHELGRTHDLPARVVMPDAAVVELSKRKPTDAAALANVTGIPRRIGSAHAADIVAAIGRGKSTAPESEPANPLADDMRVRAEGDQLWSALQARCAATGLAANLVATRAAFSRWFLAMVEARRAGTQIGCADGEHALFARDDWRHAAIGQWLDGFLVGRERLELEWSPLGMVAPGFVRPGGVASGA
jgi:ribonuclease D